VSPPDEQGMCSLGISVDIVKAATRNARKVIAEVNPRMPRTCGDSQVSVYDLDFLVPVDYQLYQYQTAELDESTRQIGEYVAALVENGSTIELGIGRIPHATLQFLAGKKDLGIHTEMLTDSLIDLVECGAITGDRKTQDRGRIVASFALGTDRLYEYLDGNPTFSFQPTEYVNDSHRISQQHEMVAINVALEVDLTGQVCADSLGTSFYSGIGGQVDFNRGAARSPHGKAIIALPSTAKSGKTTRIVPHLSPGAGVVTTRGDVHYVVTEFGVAYLHGKSVQERALALISIAHPDYRPELLEEAIDAGYVNRELQAFGNRLAVGPAKLRATMLLEDGLQISIRPIHPTDEPRMLDLFYDLSQQTLYYRFMSRSTRVPRRQIRDFTYIDHRNEIAVIATVPEAHGDEIVGIGRYYLDKTTNRAEVAFVVRDEWQGKGIGTFLYKHLSKIARGNGIGGFTAEVLPENKVMQAVFMGSGNQVRSRFEDGVVHFDIELT
ncbi:MAG: GNAT family N-acetyltransferase, partial [bacterium]|nr:GNAT family N-acetyltransferase [bacterium]